MKDTNQTFRVRKAAWALLGAAALAGCMNSPRNGTHLETTEVADPGNKFRVFTYDWEVPVTMNGAFHQGDKQLVLQQKDERSGSFSTVPSGFTSTDSSPFIIDAKNVAWFHYGRQAELRRDKRYWRVDRDPNSSGRVLKTQVRTVTVAEGLALASFDVGDATNDCGLWNQSGGGQSIINNCKSSNSPQAEVTIDCGGQDEPCCDAQNISLRDSCDGSLVCDPTRRRCTKTVYDAPIYLLEVEVAFCSDRTATGEGHLTASIGGNDPALLDTAFRDVAQGARSRFNITATAPDTIGDLRDSNLVITGADLCLDSVRLFANRQLVAVDVQRFLGPTYNRPLRTLVQGIMNANRSTAVCDAPTQFSRLELKRQIDAAFLSAIAEDDDAHFRDDSFIKIFGGQTAINKGRELGTPSAWENSLRNGALLIDAQIDAEVTIGFNFGFRVEFATMVVFGCDGNSLDISLAAPQVISTEGTNVGGDIAAGLDDVFDEPVSNIIEGKLDDALENADISALGGDLAVCPRLSVTDSNSPSLNFSYDHVAPALQPLVRSPGVLCLGL